MSSLELKGEALSKRRGKIAANIPAPPLPERLNDLPISAKFVWLYLRPLGPASATVRTLAEALGMSVPTTHDALKRLRETTPPLLIDYGPIKEREKRCFRAID